MRENLGEEILNNLVTYIHTVTKDDPEKIRQFVSEQMKLQLKKPTISNVVKSSGELKEKETPLLNFIQDVNTKHYIISPSGSVYKRSEQEKNLISDFMTHLKQVRSDAKKAMFKAKKENNNILAENENFRQANAKIKANALSGIMKSAYNLFYDPGNYNAITSTGRTIVTMSATMIEQFCAGNFCFFDINELINHVVLCQRNLPSKEDIFKCVERYKLKIPSNEELISFLFKSIEPYVIENLDIINSKIKLIVYNLKEEERIYIYYYNNLPHLFIENEKVFKPFIRNLFKEPEIDDNADPSDMFKIHEELMSVITVVNNHLISGKKVDTLPDEYPEIALKIIAIGNKFEKELERIKLLFDTFVYNSFIPPRLNNKKNMFRNSILLLDTDSNIFTLIKWVDWYDGNALKDDIENYQISSFVVYLITKVVARVLRIFSSKIGIQDKELHILNMKNEFLYPVLLLLDIKKNYLGLQAVQEGLFLPTPKLDIKGVTLRSSSVCKESHNWFIDEFVTYILKEGQKDQLDPNVLIRMVVDFENRVRESVYRGETTYLKHTSIRTANEYKNPHSSSYMCAAGWNEIFGNSYDTIQLPTKCSLLNIHKPSELFLEDLAKTNEIIYKNFIKFEKKYKKHLNIIAIHPLAKSIPVELMPIIDIRNIIYHNTSSAYRVLKNIGMQVGYKKQTELLFSDIYKF